MYTIDSQYSSSPDACYFIAIFKESVCYIRFMVLDKQNM